MFYFGYLLIAGCLIHLTTSSNIDCSKEHFLCDSGDQCVNRSKWCNKKSDCEDGSDEFYCKKAGFWYGRDPNGCEEKNETHILCYSGICIPIAARCDTYNDCKDNTDEENCKISVLYNPEPPPTETTRADYNINYDDTSDETTIASRISTQKTSTAAVTKLLKEDEQMSSTTRDTYSSLVDGHLKSSTSYYDKRLRETFSESDHLSRIFPKTVPTGAYRVDHSISQTHSRIFTRPTSATKTRSWRPPINAPSYQITYPTRRIDQQHQNVDPRYNHYQPPVHHSRSPVNHHQHLSERHQPRISHSQNPSNRYHSLDIRYQPHLNSYQPSSSFYQPSSITNQRSPNSYQPLPNSYQQSSNSYQHSSNSHQPLPNSYQRSPNSYQPFPNVYQQSSNSYHHSSNSRQPYRPIPNNSHNGHGLMNGQRNSGDQINHFKPYAPEQGVKRPFYFAKDYGSLYGKDKAKSIRDGIDWLLRQRSDSGDWGKDTPRAVVTLALSCNNSFFNGDNEGEIIKRRFMVQIGADLLKNNTEDFNINRMFMAINGLLAVCEDPTDFHGIDLAEKLRYKIDKTMENNNKPFVSLSLCLSNKSLTSTEIHNLMNQMSVTVITSERNKDTLIAAIMAFSCYVHQSSTEDSNYSRSLRSRLNEAVSRLLQYVGEDGSFGSVYTTALAAQALMSTNETYNWEADKTMSFLKHQQRQDGSFGDLLATYFVLPALSGRSLLHLRNIKCQNLNKRELTPKEILEFVGPKQHVHYSLYFGYPLVNSQSLFLYLPQGINFLDVMRVAEYQDQNFRFTLENNSSKVYSLSGLPNDSEMGQSWHLYVRQASSSYLHDPNRRFTGDLRNLSPKSGEIFIFWYHSNALE